MPRVLLRYIDWYTLGHWFSTILNSIVNAFIYMHIGCTVQACRSQMGCEQHAQLLTIWHIKLHFCMLKQESKSPPGWQLQTFLSMRDSTQWWGKTLNTNEDIQCVSPIPDHIVENKNSKNVISYSWKLKYLNRALLWKWLENVHLIGSFVS